MAFDKLKRALSGRAMDDDEINTDYLEIDLDKEAEENKVLVKLFSLKQYDDVTDILNALREGYTIAVIDIRILRKKDPIELKRAIAKIKKTTDALEGSIAGFGENIVIVTPAFAKISKEASSAKEPDGQKHKFETY